VWLEAFSQSAWSTGAGWGLLLTYAVYSRRQRDLSLEGFTTGLGNNSASLIAAIAIVATVFASLPEEGAMEVMQAGNEGLAFIWMPKIFAHDASLVGRLTTIAFFLALCFAAISSLISMTELAARVLIDMGFSRKKAVITVFVATVLLGAPSAMYMGVFKNQDWVWGLGLLVSGVLFVSCVMAYGVGRFRRRYLPSIERNVLGRHWFTVTVYGFIPLAFVAMIAWWFWSAWSWDPEGWLAPLSRCSVGTVLLQWGLVLGALVLVQLIRRRIDRR
jgi:neurotransmitter:Na+ symporter, NSS family